MVVDGGGEGAFGTLLADDKGIEVLFKGAGRYAEWSVSVSERALDRWTLGLGGVKGFGCGGYDMDVLPSAHRAHIHQ